VLREIHGMSFDVQKKLFETLSHLVGHREEREGLPELEGAEKGIVMRFSPSPSGPMHVGHVLTGMLSSLYVQKYGGTFYFRIEDTNPENVYVPAYTMLEEESKWLFGNVHEYVIQSDRMNIYYSYLEKLFAKGVVYVCMCSSEAFKQNISQKRACVCRELSKKEHHERWKTMLSPKGYAEGEAVVRFKSDVTDSNPAFRDFPLARINTASHPKQKRKYRVWPLMNLCVAVDDIEFKVSHVIRGKDHRDNAHRQKLLYRALGVEKKYPRVYFVGRFKFTTIELSASATRKLIEAGKYSGWDDIRLPFIAALRKRGYQPDAFRQLVIERGLSEVDKVISQKDFFDVLDRFNRELLRGKTKKYLFEKSTREKGNAMLVLPDGHKKYGVISGQIKKDEMVYFEKVGYARHVGKREGMREFWFAHG
jgi:glutamyl-tRNA synthetase